MIFIDDKTIKIGGIILPGIIKSIEVDTDILYEEIEVEGRADKPKQVTGYSDGKIYIDLSLHGETETEVMQKLNIVQNMFKSTNKTPYNYTIVNKHINARKIDLVVLKKITTKEASGKGFNLTVNIELFEYMPIVIQTVKTQSINTSGQNKQSASVASQYKKYAEYIAANPEKRYRSPNRSSGAPKITDKSYFSPAIENYSSAEVINNKYLI